MILFLDYDGVLHPDEVYLERGRPVLRGEGKLFIWAPILSSLLASAPDTRIVLSTSWAREFSYSRARAKLPESLRARVIGATWHSEMKQTPEINRRRFTWWDGVSRYEQIRRYVTRASLADWIAIDDGNGGWPGALRHRLIHVDGRLGTSDPHAQVALVRALANPND